ncbi:MAG: type IVa pilus pseudopilin TppE [Thiohalomonadaceae bacterium]
MKKNAGFSLIELIITVAVAATVMWFAIPNLNELVRNNRMVAQVNDVVTALNFARSEAIKRGSQVQIVAAGGSWASGWDVQLIDGTVLRTFPALGDGMTLTEAMNATTITYDGTGRVLTAATFSLCDSKRTGETGRSISVIATGRVSTSDLTCS